MSEPQRQRQSQTIPAKRKRAERAATVAEARKEREAAKNARQRANPKPRVLPIPPVGTRAWEAFAIGAVRAAVDDAKRRKRWRPEMTITYEGHRLTYQTTNLGRVIVDVGGKPAASWWGALWDD